MSDVVSTLDQKDTRSPLPETPPAPVSSGRGAAASPWVWMTLACVFLGGSGAVRAWQDYRFATVQGQVVSSPFPLTDLPTVLGDGEWRVREGAESTLDPEVAQVAGCTDSLIRTY